MTEGRAYWQESDLPAWQFAESDYPNCAAGWRYAEQIVLGEIPACEFVFLACERFLRDVTVDAWWALDPGLAEPPMVFAQLLPNIKGPRAGKPLQLAPWQAFIFLNVFGFVDERGMRRFRQGTVFVPRGNGKTTVAAPLAAYMSFVEGEGGAEGYAGATTSDQARILFSTMQAMIRCTPPMKARFGVEVGANAIFQDATTSSFKPVSSDAKTLDGFNVHVCVLDEIAAHKTAEVYDVMITAMGKRSQPFMLEISTATDNTTGIGRERWRYAEKILRRQIEDETVFAILYTIDSGDDWRDPASWRKANPNWDLSVIPKAIEALANQAQNSSAREAGFKTRHLNVWVSAADAFFNIEAWRECGDPGLEIESFEGRDCYLGMDLASTGDLAALVLLFPPREGVEEPFAAFAKCFLPEIAVTKGNNPAYLGWTNSGELITTPGDVTDFEFVEREILDARDRFNLRACAFDPWQAGQIAQRMEAEGVEMIKMSGSVGNFSEPTKYLDALIRGGRIAHDGNGPFAWCISNVVCKLDARENVFPKKERHENKIDAAIALIMALAKAIFDEAEGASVYEDEEERGGGLVLL